ncbi:MAG: ATP-binding protein [Acidobacteriota bacterium]|nr:ATP-binding protein [Acidobacteriota bacterium]
MEKPQSEKIGKVVATEKAPTTVEEFYFWTDQKLILKPFDVVKVRHIRESITYGIVEEISHITDSSSALGGFISSDFGNLDITQNMTRIGMNYVKARVLGNSKDIYTPVFDGSPVMFADSKDVEEALGLSEIKNPLPCGYVEMYVDNPVSVPVFFNSQFLIGPDGAHLNISGISGLASKTSYAMFLLKAIQDKYSKEPEDGRQSVAFVILNVKGRDLLSLDEPNKDLSEKERDIYKKLSIEPTPFENVKYFYPFASDPATVTYANELLDNQKHLGKAYQYAYTYSQDKGKIDMLFSNVEDSTGTMDSILAVINSESSEFSNITEWQRFKAELEKNKKRDSGGDKEIMVVSWRKFSRHFNRLYEKSSIFVDNLDSNKGEVRIADEIANIKKNEVFVIDIAKLEEELQGFVFGDVINAIYDLKLGRNEERDSADIPSKIIIFVDELNKYASSDVPKNSGVLRRLLEITERGRSLGIILFSVEQFRSVIHDRVKGNCSTNAYGRTNSTESSKPDYRHIPTIYRNMMPRFQPGEYIIDHPAFRSLLHIKFPRPVYKQHSNG